MDDAKKLHAELELKFERFWGQAPQYFDPVEHGRHKIVAALAWRSGYLQGVEDLMKKSSIAF